MRLLVFFALTLVAAALFAQGTQADYERANSLARRTAAKVYRERVAPRWLPDGHSFWYRVAVAPGKSEHVFVDATTGQRTGNLDADSLAALLSKRLGQPVNPRRLPRKLSREETDNENPAETEITFVNDSRHSVTLYWLPSEGERKAYVTLKPGGEHTQHTFVGHRWLAETEDGTALGNFVGTAESQNISIRENEPRTASPPTATAPAAREWRAFVREHNVWLRHRDTKEEIQLSRDGTEQNAYQGTFRWSPDGKRLLVLQIEPPEAHVVHIVESSPADQVQPKLHSSPYLKPGARIAHPRPRLFDLAARSPIPVDDALFPNPWALTELRWAPDSSYAAFLYNERGHQLMRLIVLDPATGAARTVVEERSTTFIDYSQKTTLRWLNATGELLWASERDGWNHLYRYDVKTGAVKNQVTRGPWVVHGIDDLDEASGTLWVRVLGVRAGEDPYHVHLARVRLDGSDFTVLTDGDGHHSWKWSPDRSCFVDTWSRVDLPPVSVLRRASDGALICELERADATALLASGWRMPERFVAKGRDGTTDIHGIITKPSTFDPAQSYPVIEHIYAGPHGFSVPKDWSREIDTHALAELGFIVVQIDGMGTNWRSRAFHDVAWRNLKDAGFPDRIAWLRAAATTRPWLDLARVGIYGGSAGGQNALAALLHHGDFYRAAAADCGCHDNRMDKIWWNEAWLGLVGPHYAENSNVTHAAKLTGKLLLTVGELDRNVDPASTLQVANALIKADKDFDLIVVPGGGHGAGDSPYASRRRADFFVRHLLGVEPRLK
ncbi:MAG: DPP IV N-terminal domain-containing protein [Verrucomicrobiota bacterium]